MGKLVLPGVLVGVGVVLVILSAIVGFVVVPNIIDGKIEEEVRLVKDTETWEKWMETPYPVYLKFYVFHVVNPKAIENGEKPILEEKGPYVYREERAKINVSVDTTAETVKYRQTIDYFFEPTMSVMKNGTDTIQLDVEDRVNIVNLPFIAISTSLYSRNLGFISKTIVDMLVKDGESFVREDVSIRELVFDGFNINPLYGIVLALLPEEERPPEFSENRFAFYRHNNGSNDGEYVIRTGVSDSYNFGRIVTWEGQTALDWWEAPVNTTPKANDRFCNMINGTDGSVFQPFLTEETEIRIFVTDICRSIVFEYVGEEEHLGINGFRFAFPQAFYDDPAVNDDNYCFCSPPADGLEDLCTEGLIRIFGCKNGAPIITSSPHFRKGDPYFADLFVGLNPTEEHDTYAVLEPNSGLLLKINKNVQISLEIQDFNGFFPHFQSVKQYMAFPAFWANEYVEMDQPNVDDLKGKLLTPIKIVTIAKWVIIGVGALLVAGGVGVFIARK